MKAEPSLSLVLAELRQLRADLRATSKRLLTVDETAHFWGLAPKTLRNSLGPKAAKPFPVKPVRVSGRVLFRRQDLDRFVDSLGGGGMIDAETIRQALIPSCVLMSNMIDCSKNYQGGSHGKSYQEQPPPFQRRDSGKDQGNSRILAGAKMAGYLECPG